MSPRTGSAMKKPGSRKIAPMRPEDLHDLEDNGQRFELASVGGPERRPNRRQKAPKSQKDQSPVRPNGERDRKTAFDALKLIYQASRASSVLGLARASALAGGNRRAKATLGRGATTPRKVNFAR